MSRFNGACPVLLLGLSLFFAFGISRPILSEGIGPHASLSGTLADPSGSLLIGAVVHLHSAASRRDWTSATNSRGQFRFSGLPPGDYTLSVRQNGFSELLKSISLRTGEGAHEALRLSLASVEQEVTVSSGPTNDGVTSREIREGPARDLGEATNGMAGVEMVRKAAIANDIAIRGLLHSNLAVSFDGTRMYGACTSQMDPALYHVDLSEVDHVDIVKGPFDVTTQGAMGGFVKVITKTPDTNGIRFYSNASTGSYGYYNPSATLQGGNNFIHPLIGYSYRTSEFYRDGDGHRVSDLAAYRNDDQNLQAFRTFSAWTKLAFQPFHNQRGEIAYTRQQSGDLLYPYMIMDGRFDNADRFSLRYDDLRRHAWVNGLHGLAYLDKIDHLMDNSLRSSAGTLPESMQTQVVSFTDGVRLSADLRHATSVGYEFHRHYWNSAGFMIVSMMGMQTTMQMRTLPGIVESVQGAYITYRRNLGDRALITGGARFDYSYTDASKSNPAFFEAYHDTSKTTAGDSGFSGNVKLSWQPTNELSLFTGVGSNIRFPDPEEQFFQSNSIMSGGASMDTGWVGNPLLMHPRDTEYDLGFTARQSRLTISPLFYFSNLDHYITLYGANLLKAAPGVTSTTAQSYANVHAHEWGAELTSNASLPAGLHARGTLSWTRGTKVPQPANNIFSSNLF